jgi:hypothetical protein
VTRPANPTWTTPSFAPDVNYPAGANPWNGNPTKVVWSGAASVGFTPKSGVPAQAVNYYLNQFADRDSQAKAYLQTLLDYFGQITAMNFRPLRLPASSGIWRSDCLHSAVWDPVTQRFYVATGGNGALAPKCLAVSGHGSAASDATSTVHCMQVVGPTTSVSGADYFEALDVDTVGNVVAVCKVRQGATWGPNLSTTVIDVSGVGLAHDHQWVCHNPVSSKWVAVYKISSSAGHFRTSTDRTTWTTPTETGLSYPSAETLLTGAIKKSSGRIVVITMNPSTTAIKVRTTDDDGATITNRADLTTAITTPDALQLIYNAANDTFFLLVATGITGGNQSEIWKSTDGGATWTKIKTFTSVVLRSIAANGPLMFAQTRLVSTTEAGTLISTDSGVTWKRGAMQTGTSLTTDAGGVYSTAHGFALLQQVSGADPVCYMSLAADLPSGAAIA